MSNQCTKERFLNDIKEHEITILGDDGSDRHIRFKRPGTSCYFFDLITWPGHLCISGDCGTYVFRRLQDMFEFFRTDRKADDSLAINPQYWAEKVVSSDKDGVKEFSFDTFKANIKDWIDQQEDGDKPCEDEPEELALYIAAYSELRAAIDEEVLNCDDNEVRAYDAANDFEHTGEAWQKAFGEKSQFQFVDYFETDNTAYTHGFIWNCYAIAWGISKYDAAKTLAMKEQEAAL